MVVSHQEQSHHMREKFWSVGHQMAAIHLEGSHQMVVKISSAGYQTTTFLLELSVYLRSMICSFGDFVKIFNQLLFGQL